jgi:hypothetical protein
VVDSSCAALKFLDVNVQKTSNVHRIFSCFMHLLERMNLPILVILNALNSTSRIEKG